MYVVLFVVEGACLLYVVLVEACLLSPLLQQTLTGNVVAALQVGLHYPPCNSSELVEQDAEQDCNLAGTGADGMLACELVTVHVKTRARHHLVVVSSCSGSHIDVGRVQMAFHHV